jgi:hypothetical protein
MPSHTTPFIVEPYLKATTIRSPLGFMSQATYWAQLLFPGITVLTRHFLHVELLHRELRRLKNAGERRERIEEALRSPALHKRLEQQYRRRIRKEDDKTVTKMTYWQRYGSMFEYFGLWDAPHVMGRRDLWRLVFCSHVPNEFRAWAARSENGAGRRRRIRHTRWYQRFRAQLLQSNGQVPARLLWWVTGEGGPQDASHEIRLSRRLSYAFLIWQTIFEVGVKLRLRDHVLPRASTWPVNGRAAVDLLVLAQATDEPSSDDLKRIFSGLLSAHAQQLSPGLPRWQAAVDRQEWSEPTLTRLYDGSAVKELATVPASSLFCRLVRLHQEYCRAQGKTDAEFIRADGGGFRALKFRKISASFGGAPWGLFSYRLEPAGLLYRSGIES